MSRWTKILSSAEIAEAHALTASIDPRTARLMREWYEGASDSQLLSTMRGNWLCNEDCRYQMARSYLALRGIETA